MEVLSKPYILTTQLLVEIIVYLCETMTNPN